MKRRGYFILPLAVALALALCACGQNGAIASSGKLISAYYKTDVKSGDVVVLNALAYQDGSFANTLYKGSGNHLVLFKIAKKDSKTETIAAQAEGEVANTRDYSVNIISDGDKTIVFGNFKDGAADYNKIDFVFDNGSHVTQSVQGSRGFLVVEDGSLKIKDFTLFDAKNAISSSYQAYLKAGGSITRTSFMAVSGN